MIIGRKWLRTRYMARPENRRLIWPEDRTKAEEIQEKLNMVIPREIRDAQTPTLIFKEMPTVATKMMEEEDKKIGRQLIQMNSHVDSSNKTQELNGPSPSISRYRVPRT